MASYTEEEREERERPNFASSQIISFSRHVRPPEIPTLHHLAIGGAGSMYGRRQLRTFVRRPPIIFFSSSSLGPEERESTTGNLSTAGWGVVHSPDALFLPAAKCVFVTRGKREDVPPLYYYANGMNMMVQGSDATAFLPVTNVAGSRAKILSSPPPLYIARGKKVFLVGIF